MHDDKHLQRLRVSLLLHQFPLVAKQLFDICGDVSQIAPLIDRGNVTGDYGGVKLTAKIQKHLRLIAGDRNKARLEGIIDWVQSPAHKLIILGSSDYPEQLAEIPDPPLVIYAVGNIELLRRPQLAMVGSRNPTQYGRRVTKLFAEEIAKSGIVITSGMARGIDSAAHRGALDVNGKTIAVLGTGCDQIYPPENSRLMHEIMEKGLILSEFPPGVGPASTNFPQRNRLVTGMTCGTLVVEARMRSGSLISARLAMEQGRGVFAVPGSVLSKQSEGCHYLLGEGAQLAGSVADIIEELSVSHPELRFQTEIEIEQDRPVLDKRQLLVLKALDLEPRSADRISDQIGAPIIEVMQTLVELELLGIVSSTLGTYQLLTDWKSKSV